MPSALIFLAEGAEEMETVITADVLRRGGINVVIAGVDGPGPVLCSRGVKIVPDKGLKEALSNGPYDILICPGGAKGAETLCRNSEVGKALKDQESRGGCVIAVCTEINESFNEPVSWLQHVCKQTQEESMDPSKDCALALFCIAVSGNRLQHQGFIGSEDECDQNPSFGNSSSMMTMPYASESDRMIKAGTKRSYAAISAADVAKQNDGTASIEFIKKKGSVEMKISDIACNTMIHNETRMASPDPNSLIQELFKQDNYTDVFEAKGDVLTLEKLQKIRWLMSYSCLVCAGPTFFLLGCGSWRVYFFNAKKSEGQWQILRGYNIELPNKTLLEVQAVCELGGEGKEECRQTAIYVIDAFFLCGEDIRTLSFEKRQEKLQEFVQALRKPTRTDLTQLRNAEIFPLEKVDQIFKRLEMRKVKNFANKPRLCYVTDSGCIFHPLGITIIQTVKEPWIRNHSKSTGFEYWYNVDNKKSTYDLPPESIATIRDCRMKSVHWSWMGDSVPEQLSALQFLKHIEKLRKH